LDKTKDTPINEEQQSCYYIPSRQFKGGNNVSHHYPLTLGLKKRTVSPSGLGRVDICIKTFLSIEQEID
jgi:hypothetical protein